MRRFCDLPIIVCEKIVRFQKILLEIIFCGKILWTSMKKILWFSVRGCSNLLWEASLIFYEKILFFCEKIVGSSIKKKSFNIPWEVPLIFLIFEKNIIWCSKIISDDQMKIICFFIVKSSSRISPDLLWDLPWEDYVFHEKIL